MLLKKRRTKAVYVPSGGAPQQPAQVIIRPDGTVMCNGRPDECQKLLATLPAAQRALL